MPRSIAGKPIVRQLFASSQVGVVVSAGRMSKAVKVRIAGQEWNKKFKKYFPSPKNYLVADPTSALVEGDVIRIASGWRTSKLIRHVVTAIVAPFGEPVENRPPILTEQQRMDIRIRERLLKDVRSAEKGRVVSKSRLAEARRQKLEIPSLEEAMRNVRLADQEPKSAVKVSKQETHAGQAGQAETKNARRVDAGKEIKEEKKAEKKVKRGRRQTN